MYGAPYLIERAAVWRMLRGIIWSHPGKLVAIGDYNQLELHDKKIGGNSAIPGSHDFSKWRVDCGMLDIPFHGAAFTWSNNRLGDGIIYERLDRVYCSGDWRDCFPNAVVWNLPILISDHGPIILDNAPTPMTKKRPYRVESWCLGMD